MNPVRTLPYRLFKIRFLEMLWRSLSPEISFAWHLVLVFVDDGVSVGCTRWFVFYKLDFQAQQTGCAGYVLKLKLWKWFCDRAFKCTDMANFIKFFSSSVNFLFISLIIFHVRAFSQVSKVNSYPRSCLFLARARANRSNHQWGTCSINEQPQHSPMR